jgi:hypothetical protein
MTKRFLRTVGLVLLWGVPLWGLAPTAAKAGDAPCCNCCSHCGCKLVPQCDITCATKKETTYKYTSKCETICIPGVSCLLNCDDDCCKCRVRQVNKLYKVPSTKEVTARKCSVTWTCPNCGGAYGGSESSGKPAAAPGEPQPSVPVAAPRLPQAPTPQPPSGQR